MNFKQFLAGRKSVFDATGYFVRLSKIDHDFPTPCSLAELQDYIFAKYRNTDICLTAATLWDEYQTAEVSNRKIGRKLQS